MIGARQEIYRQTVLPIDLLDFSGSYIINLQNDLLDPNQRLAVQEDDVFLSTALTYKGMGALGAGDFQVRLSYGQTVVRPDLREVADVIYIDPELDIRVQGNPGLRPSPIDNFEVRSEFFYSSGDNFTVSLFYKDMQAPIEQIRSAGSDDDVVLGFTNAESGKVYGLELEGLKALPHGLFVSGNATLSDSKIVIDRNLSTVLTNFERRLTGHSEWVLNTTLGWDSPSAMHSAYLNLNVFGERIFFAGTGGNDDAYEQPFYSLGLVYKYFPTDNLNLEFSLDNILDEKREFLQRNAGGTSARILVQNVGADISIGMRWAF
jgi:outer membrane receptor protein involved in Fe transport